MARVLAAADEETTRGNVNRIGINEMERGGGRKERECRSGINF